MKHRAAILCLTAVALASPANAQNVANRIAATDGVVQVLFPSAPNVCGDGESFIRTQHGRGQDHVVSESGSSSTHGSWSSRRCVHGPTRVVATVLGGEITRMNVHVGPVPRAASETRSLTVSATDAMAWLGELVLRPESRVASKAMQAMTFADAPAPWPLLLRVARDVNRSREVRRSAMLWLSIGVNDKLGLSDVDERANDDVEMRTQAVFVLSQRPKNESVPELIELARTAKHPAARKAAIFWLGQSGDPRAPNVFAELLGVR